MNSPRAFRASGFEIFWKLMTVWGPRSTEALEATPPDLPKGLILSYGMPEDAAVFAIRTAHAASFDFPVDLKSGRFTFFD